MIDTFCQCSALAYADLISVARRILQSPELVSTDRRLQDLTSSLQRLVNARDPSDPSSDAAGHALRCLWNSGIIWDLPKDKQGGFRELARVLRISIVRRAQSMLYDELVLYPVTSFDDDRRKWFLDSCWRQMGQAFENQTNTLLNAYHKEFGNGLSETTFSLNCNLFPSSTEWKAQCWHNENYPGLERRPKKPRKKTLATTTAPTGSSSDSDNAPTAASTNPQEGSTGPPQEACQANGQDRWREDRYEDSNERSQGCRSDLPTRPAATGAPSADGDVRPASTWGDDDRRECESEDRSCWALRTTNSYSDYGGRWRSRGISAACGQDGGHLELPSDKVLCLLELLGTCAWIDDQADNTTASFCEVSVGNGWLMSKQGNNVVSNYRLHYRLMTLLSLLVDHPKCILGVTVGNRRYAGVAADALCQLLKQCTGGDWTCHSDVYPQYVHNEKSNQKVFLWTTVNYLLRSNESAHGTQQEYKDCNKIWRDLSQAGLQCRFDSHNTVCMEYRFSKQNFDRRENIVYVPDWPLERWVKGIPEVPLQVELSESELRFENLLRGILDTADTDMDVRPTLAKAATNAVQNC